MSPTAYASAILKASWQQKQASTVIFPTMSSYSNELSQNVAGFCAPQGPVHILRECVAVHVRIQMLVLVRPDLCFDLHLETEKSHVHALMLRYSVAYSLCTVAHQFCGSCGTVAIDGLSVATLRSVGGVFLRCEAKYIGPLLHCLLIWCVE